VKAALLALALIGGSDLTAANACVERAETYQGRPVKYSMCTAPVEEAIKANVDGYVMIAYVVKLEGQRVIVEDPLSETQYTAGDTILFMLMKFDAPSDTKRRLPPRLWATVIDPKGFPGEPE